MARVLVAVILTVIAVSTLKHRVFPATDPQALKNEEIVLGNCLSIEVSGALSCSIAKDGSAD